jgi:hypothetical protein
MHYVIKGRITRRRIQSFVVERYRSGERDLGKMAAAFNCTPELIKKCLKQAGEIKRWANPLCPLGHLKIRRKSGYLECMECKGERHRQRMMRIRSNAEQHEAWKARNRAQRLARFNGDPTYTLAHRLRTNLRAGLVRGRIRKDSHTLQLLGCSLPEFIQYLLRPFPEGADLQELLKTHHLDHIRPVDSFDLTKKKELAKCFRYNNMQLLLGPENISKGPRYLKQQELLVCG